jgi:hypothetical protein
MTDMALVKASWSIVALFVYNARLAEFCITNTA